VQNIKEASLEAKNRILSYIKKTPLKYSQQLSALSGVSVYLKCENLQFTGSFKIRGALNKLLSLSAEEKSKGVVTASTGNHGAAVAFALNKLSISGTIFVPYGASVKKINNIKSFGAEVAFYGNDCMQTELHAIEYAQKHDMVYISPYNDLDIITGQGTIALELFDQLQNIDAIFVPIGGGGLISGIARLIKTVSPSTKIIGCMPINSPVMQKSIEVGHIVDIPVFDTLSDATAGGIEPGAITFKICQDYVDDYILLTEQEIKAALNYAYQFHNLQIEGASALTISAILKSKDAFLNKNVVALLSGGNIDVELLASVLKESHSFDVTV